jgi:hypothetical protein
VAGVAQAGDGDVNGAERISEGRVSVRQRHEIEGAQLKLMPV